MNPEIRAPSLASCGNMFVDIVRSKTLSDKRPYNTGQNLNFYELKKKISS